LRNAIVCNELDGIRKDGSKSNRLCDSDEGEEK